MMSATEIEIVRLLKEHAGTRLKFDILLFWSKYPEAKFTCGIITRAVRCKRRPDVEEALECFAEAELLEKHSSEGLQLYCLTKDPHRRQCVVDLASHVNGFLPNRYLAMRGLANLN